MKLNIGLIVSEPLREITEQLLPELYPYCAARVMIAADTPQARQFYQDHINRFDAFIFSGRMFLLYATRGVLNTAKPCYCIDDFAADSKTIFLKLLLENREFDFSRVSIDVVSDDAAPMDLLELLPAGQMPHRLGVRFSDYFSNAENLSENIETLNRLMLDGHIRLYREGKTDLAITRFGVIAPALKKAGVPCVYMLPTKEYIFNLVLQVVNSLGIKYAEDRMTSAILIRAGGSDREEIKRTVAACAKGLASLARTGGYDLAVFIHRDWLEAVTNLKDLSKMTRGFTCAEFVREIGMCGDVIVGLGSGVSIFQARLNAASAANISGARGKRTYYVGHNNNVIGPLGSGAREYVRTPGDELLALAERFGLDHVRLQKVVSFARLKNTNTATTDEFAAFMDVTVRTANRILGKISEAGGARVYEENIGGGKGRPKKHYELLFLGELHGEAAS